MSFDPCRGSRSQRATAPPFPPTSVPDAGVIEHRRPSERLRAAASGGGTVGAITDALGPDAPFMLLLLLAAFALVPGAAPVFATCMIVVAASLLVGREQLALPAALRRRSVPPATLDRAVNRLERFERHVGAGRGRAPTSVRPAAILVIWNAILVTLPIPLGNGPPAIAAILISLGIVERNRKALAVGIAATVAATIFEAALVWAGIDLVGWVWRALGL